MRSNASDDIFITFAPKTRNCHLKRKQNRKQRITGMIDRTEYKKAGAFVNPGDAYLLYEKKSGKLGEMLISGDGQEMINGVCGLIRRVSKQFGVPVIETAETIFALLSLGGETETALEPGAEPPEDETAEALATMTAQNKALLAKLAEAQKDLDLARNTSKSARVQIEAERRQATADKAKLTKEILRLEHENEALREKLRFGRND